ncbi:DUF2397 family protein [Streptomyces globisporus]|uniref:DUF2397 family protein n=1 Tax=Streptomyces globisporus TaxID=1908 RepID=UPI0037B250B9
MIVTAPSASTGALPGPFGFGPFAHLTVPNTPLYREVMRTFLMAKERFAVHLRPEDVHTALPADVRPAEPDAVVGALDRLVGWGNLRADPDTARVTGRGLLPEAVHLPAHEGGGGCRGGPVRL